MGRRQPWRRWTAAEEAALRRALADGATCAEAAAELGRTYGAVRSRVLGRRLRALPRGGVPDVDARVELLGLFARGLSGCEAARVLGKSQGSVSEMARRMARDGLLRRVGTNTFNVRYVPA